MTIVLFIIFGFTLIHLAASLLTTALCLYDAGEPLFPDIPSADATPLKERLGSIGREVGLQTLFRILWPLGLLPERLPLALAKGKGEEGGEEASLDVALVEAENKRRPVLLIHGYAHNRVVLYPLKVWLKKKGFRALTFDHSRDRGSIEDKARQLARRVEILKQLMGQEEIDIVAHSLGGLVARYYIEHLDGADSVANLITLGTPHHGTRMGIFAQGTLGSQLLPGSDIIKSLAQSLDALKDVNYTAIAGSLDTVIFPADAARLPAPHGGQTLEGLGHNTLLGNIRVFQAIRESLEGPKDTPEEEPRPELIPGKRHLSLVRFDMPSAERRGDPRNLGASGRGEEGPRDGDLLPTETEVEAQMPPATSESETTEGPEESGREDT